MMKYILHVLLCCFSLHTNAQGISFTDNNFKDALAKAKSENKILFVDFMATWCGPCKKLTEEVFTNKEIGNYFNQKFVCLQIDVDKEKGLAKKYKVNQMPTLIFFDQSGKEIKRILGFTSAFSLLRSAKLLTGDTPTLEKQWETIQKDKENLLLQQQLLLEAPVILQEIKDKSEIQKWQYRIDRLVGNYLASKPREEMINLNDLSVIMTYCMKPKKNNEPMEFVIKHLPEFMKIVPNHVMVTYLLRYLDGTVNQLAIAGDPEYKKQIDRVNGDLKIVFDSVKTRSLPVEYLMTAKADALYALYGQKDQAKYIAEKLDFFGKMGDMANKEEYQAAVMHLMTGARDKLTKESAEQLLLWLDKLLTFELDADNRALVLSNMGDCYLSLKNNEKAKECYNQAYLISFQTQNIKVQSYLRQKMSSI